MTTPTSDIRKRREDFQSLKMWVTISLLAALSFLATAILEHRFVPVGIAMTVISVASYAWMKYQERNIPGGVSTTSDWINLGLSMTPVTVLFGGFSLVARPPLPMTVILILVAFLLGSFAVAVGRRQEKTS